MREQLQRPVSSPLAPNLMCTSGSSNSSLPKCEGLFYSFCLLLPFPSFHCPGSIIERLFPRNTPSTTVNGSHTLHCVTLHIDCCFTLYLLLLQVLLYDSTITKRSKKAQKNKNKNRKNKEASAVRSPMCTHSRTPLLTPSQCKVCVYYLLSYLLSPNE